MSGTMRCLVASVAVLLGAAGFAGSSAAEITGVHLILSPYGGYTLWDSNTNIEDKPIIGGRLGIMLNSYLGIEGDYGYVFGQTTEGPTPWVPQNPVAGGVDGNIQDLGTHLHLNLIPSAGVIPYLIAGYHWMKFESDDPTQETVNLDGFSAGVGLKFRLGTRAALRFEGRGVHFSFDDPAPNDDKNINYFVTGGLEFAIGGHQRDTDGDGVTDKKDRCPETPLGALVDAHGCPLDGDGDGVYDGLDQCPNTPAGARVDAHGCPTDQDQDGVFDGIDKCPDTPSGVKVDADGCPIDSDQDGVFDGLDQCPNTPLGAKVDATGCPIDSDQDGVFDGIDKCPNTPLNARVDVDGCPIVISEKEIELLDTGKITVRNIQFDTGKWDIKAESYSVLDEIGGILIQWPDLRIEIGGHADSQGSDKFNLDLSKKRAQAVLDYLIQKFPQINASQYTAEGYGEAQPVATNATAAGRAQNRRVEFKVLNTEVLKKEHERRRTLQKN